MIAKDIKIAENITWNWETTSIDGTKQEQWIELDVAEYNDVVDDKPLKGERSLIDIYSRCNVAEVEAIDFEEVINSKVWIIIMKEELTMIEKNETWMLEDRSVHKKVIGVKWIFKTKFNIDGNINKHKVRLVVKRVCIRTRYWIHWHICSSIQAWYNKALTCFSSTKW